MSSSTSASRTSTWVGIAVGVVLLGLLAAFAIALPKGTGTGDDGSTVELALPDTLPGGLAAADDPASFEGGQLAAQAETIAEQQRSNDAYGNEVLPEVLGTSAATRTYVVDGTKAVYVQAFHSEGGAFAPNTLADPDAAEGTPANAMEQVGDGVCILSYGQPQPGQDAGTPVFSQCQVTHDDLTVQVGASQVAAEDLVDAADGLLDELQDQ